MKTLKSWKTPRLITYVIGIIIGLLSLYYFITKFTNPSMALLYADLELADASRIVSRLEKQDIPHSIKAEGTQIYVPTHRVARLRMDMAEAGLPKGGIVGYEIFDHNDAETPSSFMHDIKHLRALEGELARTISSLESVISARVHLVLPKRELILKEQQQPTASIVLRIHKTSKLTQSKVLAIQHLVASAVPGLAPQRVSIVDDQGNLLARSDAVASSLNTYNLEEVRVAYETRTAEMIENLVSKYVGADKVRAEVTAEIDTVHFIKEEERYNPDGQVERSRQVKQRADEPHNIREENVQYEVSRSIEKHSREAGSVKRLSVAVVVDGHYTRNSFGEDIYEPRSAEEMEQLKKLVASAIGFNAERKDQLEVINMPFAKIEKKYEMQVDYAEPVVAFKHSELLRLVELLIFIIASLLGVMFIIKPLGFRFTLSRKEENKVLSPDQRYSSFYASSGSLIEDAKQPTHPQSHALNESHKTTNKAMKETPQQRIKNIFDHDVDEAIIVLRSWLHEGK